jgi:hypothetical protein
MYMEVRGGLLADIVRWLDFDRQFLTSVTSPRDKLELVTIRSLLMA